jgi:hypothetical protein
MSGRIQGEAKDTRPMARERKSEVIEIPWEISIVSNSAVSGPVIIPKRNNLSQGKVFAIFA